MKDHVTAREMAIVIPLTRNALSKLLDNFYERYVTDVEHWVRRLSSPRQRALWLCLGIPVAVATIGCHSSLRVGRTTVDAATEVRFGGDGPEIIPDARDTVGGSDVAAMADTGKDVGNDGADELRSARLELLAGGLGGSGNRDGIGTAARFDLPHRVSSDGAGHLFVTEYPAHAIRKIVIATGEVTTLAGLPETAGYTNGTGDAARFNCPAGMAMDGAGNLFVADYGNHMIRKVVVATGEVSTLAGTARNLGHADGTGADAQFSGPYGMTSDGAGNLFVTDNGNTTIRKVVIATGEVSTLAGTAGIAGNAQAGIISDGVGNLFVTDGENGTIRKVVIATGEVSTLAGTAGIAGSADGTGADAQFDRPSDVTIDGMGNLFVTDYHNNAIRKVVIATREVTTFADILEPRGILADGKGDLFVADSDRSTIRKVVIATGEVTTLAGSPELEQTGSTDGIGDSARFYGPNGAASDAAGNLFLADYYNPTSRKVVIATGEVSTLAGRAGDPGSVDGAASDARFHSPYGVASDGTGNLFVTDSENGTIRKVVIATGEVSTLAARFTGLTGVTSDGAGNLFVGDAYHHTILKVVIATAEVSTLAGSPGYSGSADGNQADARFYAPGGVTIDGTGNLFVADTDNYTIRKVVIATGEVSTLAGSPGHIGADDGSEAGALFSFPNDVVSDGAGNLFVADRGNHAIRKVAIATGAVTTVVGTPGRRGVALGPLPAGLSYPVGLALGPLGELFIVDRGEHAVLVARF
jgi:hypothetical protein